jgi:Xaa-Pro aminopeptidase
MQERLEKLRALLSANADKYDGIFISKAENRAYLSGFTGSYGFLIVTPNEATLITDGRYLEQARQQAPGWTVKETKRPHEAYIVPAIKDSGVARLGFEADHMTVNDHDYWRSQANFVEWVNTSGLVARMRWAKDETEVEAIQAAVNIAERALDKVLGILKPGMTERDVAAELEYSMRKFGADSIAFDSIVASGVRSAMPHGRASDKVIGKGEFVTFDFGARLNGYNSDITRTVFVGKQPTDEHRRVYNLVLEAQLAGIEAVRPGATCKAVDDIPRQIFQRANMLKYYLHSTGHNLGREVHESPFLTPTDETPLEPGMVLTIEPGLYIENWGGVRIEDDLVVTPSGNRVLPSFSKELILV